MPVVRPDRGITEQHAAAAVGLQAVLVGVDDDGIDVGHAVEGGARLGREVVGEPVVAAVGTVGVQAEAVALAQREDLRQRVDGAGRGRAECRNHGADAAGREALLERRGIHAREAVDGHRFEGQLQHRADAAVRVVGLAGGEHGRAGFQFARDPERLEVRHRAAARQVTEVRVPAEHARDRGDGFLFHRRARPAAVERVVVWVDPRGERVGETGDRVRRLQHLARVLRVEVRVVVLQAGGGLEQYFAQRLGIAGAGGVVRKVLEALLQDRERVLQQEQ